MVAVRSPREVLSVVEYVSVRVSITLTVLVGTLEEVIEGDLELVEGSRALEEEDTEESEVVTERLSVKCPS